MCFEQRRVAAVSAAVWTLVTGLIALYLVLFVLTAASRLAHSADEFTYGESWLLDGARRVARGEGLYAPPDQIPMMHIAYTPLYYAAVGGLHIIFGDSGYTVGRAVSLIATMAGAAALVWSVRYLTQRWSFGLLAGGLFLTQNLTIVLWAPMHRVDPLALGLTLVGLALATARRLSLAAVIFLLAVLTKQTFIVAPIAVAVCFWPHRRSCIRFVGIFLGGLAVAVGVAQWTTHGWFLWHTVTANSNQPELMTFASLMGSFLQYNGLPVLAALGSFLLPAQPGERLWRAYFLGCLVTLPTLAKLGASSNYWLEGSAATSALLALGAYHLEPLSPSPTRLVAPIVAAGALFIAIPAYQNNATEASVFVGELIWPPSPRYLSLVGDAGNMPLRVEASFVDQVAREPGEVLTDNAGLAVAAGKRIEYEFQIFQLLKAEGRWSEKPILEAVTNRRFSLLALMHSLDGPVDGTRWTPALHSAMRGGYSLVRHQAGFWLYRPRSSG